MESEHWTPLDNAAPPAKRQRTEAYVHPSKPALSPNLHLQESLTEMPAENEDFVAWFRQNEADIEAESDQAVKETKFEIFRSTLEGYYELLEEMGKMDFTEDDKKVLVNIAKICERLITGGQLGPLYSFVFDVSLLAAHCYEEWQKYDGEEEERVARETKTSGEAGVER